MKQSSCSHVKGANKVHVQYIRWQIMVRKIRESKKISDQERSPFKSFTLGAVRKMDGRGQPRMQKAPRGVRCVDKGGPGGEKELTWAGPDGLDVGARERGAEDDALLGLSENFSRAAPGLGLSLPVPITASSFLYSPHFPESCYPVTSQEILHRG